MTHTVPNGAISSSTTHVFEAEASIVLVGARGTGKSSLAHIASTSFHMTHIDFNNAFQTETGLSRTAFRKQHGTPQSRDRELSLLKSVLDNHSKNSVIVLPGDYTEEAGLLLVKEYSADHPVILVKRCLTAIQRYLKPWDTSKVKRLLDLVDPVYRSCSRFEFYNLDEAEEAEGGTSTKDQTLPATAEPNSQKPWSLRLKHLEQDFIQFANNIRHPPSASERSLNQAIGKYLAPNSYAVYTYLLRVSVSQVLHSDFKVAWLDCGAEACQLEVALSRTGQTSVIGPRAEDIDRAFAVARRHFDGPIIYHVQLPTSPNKSLEIQYAELVRHGLRLGADYITIDLAGFPERYVSLSDAKNIVRLIGDYHDDDPGMDGWSTQKRWSIFLKARDLGLHGLRLTQVALSSDDNRAATHFVVQASRTPGQKPFVIAYNTALLGRPSLCFNRTLTPITTTDLQNQLPDKEDSLMLDTPITIQQSQAALYASFVFDARKYFIIGFDVSYSLSPIAHNAAHQFFGMPHRLHTRSMPSLDRFDELMNDPKFGGGSIAQGYKLSILSRVSAMSDHAQTIGAINTLIPIRASWDYTKPATAEFWAARNRSGPVLGLYGDNTDWVGLSRCVAQNLSPANVVTARTTALIVGAGGMARAAFYALVRMGVRQIVLFNRTLSHAAALAQHFSDLGLTAAWDSKQHRSSSENETGLPVKPQVRLLESLNSPWFPDIAQPNIIIACIPASPAAGQPVPNFTLPQEWMMSQTGGVVLDLNYRPLVTPLLRQVRARSEKGWVAVDGLENLAAQGSAQFKLFTSRKVPKNLMRIAILKYCLAVHQDDEEICSILKNQLAQLHVNP